MPILKGILGFIFLSLPAIGPVIGIVLAFHRRQETSRLRLGATIISLVAVVAENIYFIGVFVLLPNGAGPVYNDSVYQRHERLEVFGVRSLLAVLPVALVGAGIGRGIAIAGTIVLFFIWIGIGINPWG
jgi:hypothetical protein